MKRAKYNNKKVVIDGVTFDSKTEAKRYEDLKQLERAGEISDLQLQPRFKLIQGVKFTGDARAKPDIRYTADFAYTNTKTGQRVIEDVKSKITREKTDYKMRRHMMLAIHNIEVLETY